MTASPLPPDPYNALGVSKDATTDQVRSSYRKLVLKAHPDRFPQATQEEKQKKTDEFHKIQQAYELLSDDTRRQRYDERVKLAELKAELLKEQAASARKPGRSAPSSGDYSNLRSFNVPTWENRANAFYEERTPKATPKKSYDDDFSAPRYDAQAPFDDYRSSPRASKQEDVYRNGSRKTSYKEYDDKPTARGAQREDREWEEKVAAKERAKREKEREARERDAKKRSKDKNRRAATESKSQYNSPRIDDFTDSELSEVDHSRPAASSRRRAREDAGRKTFKDERSARRSRDAGEYSDLDDERSHHDYYYRQTTREKEAWDYIKQAQQARKQLSDPEDRPRASLRSSSARNTVAPPPPPSPPPAPKEKADSAKRSSATKKSSTRASPPRESRSSRKEKAMPEILDPEPKSSRRTAHDPGRVRPSLKVTDSAPPRFDDEPRHPVKAPTYHGRSTRERERERELSRLDKEPLPIRRAQTGGLEHMVSGYKSQKSTHGASKLRRAETMREAESDSESEPDTPDAHMPSVPPMMSPRTTTTQFRWVEEPEDLDGARVIGITPASDPRRTSRRDTSPRTRERAASRDTSPKRPSMQTRTSTSQRMPQRGASFAEPSSSPKSSPRIPPGFQRSSSARNDMLFGEVSRDPNDDRPRPMRTGSGASHTYKYADVSFAPPISKADVSYSDRRRSPGAKERRGGEREEQREARDSRGRETYPSPRESLRHGPSGLGRQASYAGKAY